MDSSFIASLDNLICTFCCVRRCVFMGVRQWSLTHKLLKYNEDAITNYSNTPSHPLSPNHYHPRSQSPPEDPSLGGAQHATEGHLPIQVLIIT